MTTVQTARGPMDSSELGRVLVHEHVFLMGEEFRQSYAERRYFAGSGESLRGSGAPQVAPPERSAVGPLHLVGRTTVPRSRTQPAEEQSPLLRHRLQYCNRRRSHRP